MKKNIIIGISIGLLLLILLIISFNVGDKTVAEGQLSNDSATILANAQKESKAVKTEEKKEFIQVDVNKYLDYYSGTENSLILVARPTCGYCQVAEPIIQNIMFENNLDINYLNTDEFTEELEKKFVESDETFKSGFGTPMLLVVSNNKIIDKVDGLTDKAHYIDFLKNNKFI